MYGSYLTLRSKGHVDVSNEGPPLAGLIWNSTALVDFSDFYAFLEFLSCWPFLVVWTTVASSLEDDILSINK